MKFTILSTVFALISIVSFSCSYSYSNEGHELESNTRLKEHAAELKKFAAAKNLNEETAILIDMKISSGKNRFFLYNMKKDSVLLSGLVAHGSCNENWLEGRKYSNTPGSCCTSLGKYKIGKSYYGQFGLAWKLYGLEGTNSNAFERFVVFHAHDCVPEQEVDDEICQSNGCPMVSVGMLKKIKPVLDKSQKPVLLWIFD